MRRSWLEGSALKMSEPKPAIAVGGVVHNLRDGRLDAQIAAVSIHAGVVGEALGVAAEAELASLVW